MDLHLLLDNLAHKGVKLSSNKGLLFVDAPKGVMTPELQESLVEHKAEILMLLHQNNMDASDTSLPKVVPAPESRYEPFPLTDMQHAFWVGRSGVLELGTVANHGYYEIEGHDLDLERLNWALQKSIERHDMLRAVVLPDGQQQVLKQVPPYQIEILDLRGQEEHIVASEIDAIRQQMSHQVLPADQWPLFEFRATQLDDGRARLHISYDLQIFDAWSLFLLFDEWFQLYQDPEIELVPLELSFRDYVLVEQALQETDLYQRSQQYWFSRLDDLPPAPLLPLAKSPKELKQYRTNRYEDRLGQTDWQLLKQKAAQAGLTPSGVLLAAFTEILTAWNRIPRFTISLALFNRLPLHPQVSNILGDFISATLLAVDNSGSDSFTDRAIRLQQQLWQDLEHRYFSGVRVTRELARRKGTAPSAIPIVFTSTLGLSSLGQETSTFSNFGELVYGISQASQAWMDVQVWEEKGELTFNWDVVDELFPEGLIQEMFKAYRLFLKRLATSETAWLETNRQLIPPAQLAQRCLVNATVTPITDERLHTLFEAQVQSRKNEPAVISSQRTLSYQELYELSNQLGHRLRTLGVIPNQLVAVVMEKGWEQIVAVMGILAAGAAYVPIDPGLPQERREYLLSNSESDIVLTQPWLKETLVWPDGVLQLCIGSQDLEGESREPLETIQKPSDLAYLIYTSGSTGVPKGVMINHRGAVNTILDINRRFKVSPSDRVFALSSLSFDLSVYDIFGALAAGGAMVIPNASCEREPVHWVQLISQHRVTIWNSVPALMQMMVDCAANESRALGNLRLILLSGDWLPLTLPNQIKALIKDVQVISLGGATEASIWSILYPIQEANPSWKSIPYGRPMDNQGFHVLNESLSPCPVWVLGQLYISGIGLAMGYWREEAKTTASFITHPQTGERLYRTGDLGRYLPDGNIEFLGREDFQVKIGGYRIELGEIEAMLVRHPAVDKAVVTVLGKQLNEKRLVAYVVAKKQLSINELRCFLREYLPEYMLPSAFVFLENLPLSANGKVDRRALPIPDISVGELKVDYVAPQNDIEQTIAVIWQAVLNLEKVGINNNFFEVGGNSLLITKVYSQLKDVFPDMIKCVSLVDLFKYPTVCSLAKRLNQAQQITLSELESLELDKQLSVGKTRLKQRLKKSRDANLQV
ncbi:MAG: amino acid adenylation domain-containing protein [Cyanobacteria bacterium J06635_15]